MYLHLIKYSTRLLRVDLGSGARNVFVLFLITRLDPLSPICRKKTPIKSIKVLVHVYQIIFESIIGNYKIPLIRSYNILPLLIKELTKSWTTLIFTLIYSSYPWAFYCRTACRIWIRRTESLGAFPDPVSSIAFVLKNNNFNTLLISTFVNKNNCSLIKNKIKFQVKGLRILPLRLLLLYCVHNLRQVRGMSWYFFWPPVLHCFHPLSKKKDNQTIYMLHVYQSFLKVHVPIIVSK